MQATSGTEATDLKWSGRLRVGASPAARARPSDACACAEHVWVYGLGVWATIARCVCLELIERFRLSVSLRACEASSPHTAAAFGVDVFGGVFAIVAALPLPCHLIVVAPVFQIFARVVGELGESPVSLSTHICTHTTQPAREGLLSPPWRTKAPALRPTALAVTLSA